MHYYHEGNKINANAQLEPTGDEFSPLPRQFSRSSEEEPFDSKQWTPIPRDPHLTHRVS